MARIADVKLLVSALAIFHCFRAASDVVDGDFGRVIFCNLLPIGGTSGRRSRNIRGIPVENHWPDASTAICLRVHACCSLRTVVRRDVAAVVASTRHGVDDSVARWNRRQPSDGRHRRFQWTIPRPDAQLHRRWKRNPRRQRNNSHNNN